MHTRKLGSLEVSAVGLGCMNMSMGYGAADRDTSIRLLNEALDSGYSFLDTATLYGGGHNELLIGEALRTRRNEYVLASKCGMERDIDGKTVTDGRPENIKRQCENSLKRLQTDVIDLYYLHRMDAGVPIEESVGALGDLVKEGKLREIGLSEISSETLMRAHKEFPVGAVQSEYSLWSRTPELKMLATCEALGVAFVPFSPLGRQFLTGKSVNNSLLGPEDIRCTNAKPRFDPACFGQNIKLLDPYSKVANRVGCSMAQLALAWVLSQQDSQGHKRLIPIPGTKHIEYMHENRQASEIALDDDTIAELNDLINEMTIAGERYTDALMKSIDSERDRDV
ncbi:aldo/keto reductase [Leucothrix arctica]|uniref:Aldo/keto reductase n=1 Tax=Leucothrix arctica TaxID=1481894 RepID=A0A317CIB2_9GAMM|nr:aldo/keto reductase [Leucothrix arctica]PWQ97911.1 aldo/keto reductase [Leucothrix arctica]